MIKDCLVQMLSHIVYNLYSMSFLKMKHNISVAGIEETIDMLLDTDNSLVRFGDGEIVMIRGKDLSFQTNTGDLSKRMKDILEYKDAGLMVAIQDIFDGVDMYVPASKRFWERHLLFCRKIYEQCCVSDKKYYSTLFSRCYITLKDKSRCGIWFDKIKHIWTDKEVVVVEGTRSKNGVYNDLFSSATSVERIIGPPENAYGKYNDILRECMKIGRNKLFLVSLGPTAKPLVQDLHRAGYRVIDIGNLDSEYNWFLAGYQTKEDAKDLPVEILNDKEMIANYESQIIARL